METRAIPNKKRDTIAYKKYIGALPFTISNIECQQNMHLIYESS